LLIPCVVPWGSGKCVRRSTTRSFEAPRACIYLLRPRPMSVQRLQGRRSTKVTLSWVMRTTGPYCQWSPSASYMSTHRNLDACAPPAPCDPAPLLLSRAQARLNFGSSPVHPLLTLLTAPWRSQDPSHYKLSTFNEGPRNKARGPENVNHCIFLTCACQNFPQAFV
jgi:hypothetical protein